MRKRLVPLQTCSHQYFISSKLWFLYSTLRSQNWTMGTCPTSFIRATKLKNDRILSTFFFLFLPSCFLKFERTKWIFKGEKIIYICSIVWFFEGGGLTHVPAIKCIGHNIDEERFAMKKSAQLGRHPNWVTVNCTCKGENPNWGTPIGSIGKCTPQLKKQQSVRGICIYTPQLGCRVLIFFKFFLKSLQSL